MTIPIADQLAQNRRRENDRRESRRRDSDRAHHYAEQALIAAALRVADVGPTPDALASLAEIAAAWRATQPEGALTR